jgi:hypothetical protein
MGILPEFHRPQNSTEILSPLPLCSDVDLRRGLGPDIMPNDL